MREKGACPYQNACLYTHALTELAVWNYQKERDLRDQDILFSRIQEEISGNEPATKRACFTG